MKGWKIEAPSSRQEGDSAPRLVDLLRQQGVEIPLMCGGTGACSTCHLHVVEGMENLNPPTACEKMMLGLISAAEPRSRLGCQARLIRGKAVVEAPGVQYLTALQDLEAMVGMRTPNDIVHPLDGRVLVERGKIITRSRIEALKGVDADIADLMRRAETQSNLEIL
jgi:ferredoxin